MSDDLISAPLAPGRCLLFAYGQLQPSRRAPRSVTRNWPDRVRGELYDLGPFPGAVRVGAGDRWFHGFVMEIAEAEFAADLDAYEGVPDGAYRRIRTTTERGAEAWIYEYARPIPPLAPGPLDQWTPPLKSPARS